MGNKQVRLSTDLLTKADKLAESISKQYNNMPIKNTQVIESAINLLEQEHQLELKFNKPIILKVDGQEIEALNYKDLKQKLN